MSGITDPSEEYFKDGLWGWVVNQWKKLTADAAGHLQIDVVSSGLPAGGATAANQATMITALQLIDDLTNALNSIATDELDIVFDGQNADVEVTQTTPADLLTGIHGWDGALWRKLPLLWGYSDTYSELITSPNVAAGNHVLTASTPGAGEVWIVTNVAARCSTNTPSLIDIIRRVGGTWHHLKAEPYTVASSTVDWHGKVVLKQGDDITVYFQNCALNDNLDVAINGYKMLITA